MKTKFCMLMSVLLLLGSFSSCSKGDDPDTIYQQAITNCFTLYKNITTGASQPGASTNYAIEINYTKSTCNLTITGLALPDGTSYPAVSLSDIPFKITDESLVSANAASVQSSINGFATAPVFSNVQMRLFHRNINDSYQPAYVLRFNIGSFEVISSMKEIYLYGETVSTGPDGKPFSYNETVYIINMANSLDKATITMSGAHFIEQMPSMDIELPDVPATFDGLTLNINAGFVTPAIKGVPNPGFPITNLVSSIDITGDSRISFTCDPKPMDGIFNVVATLDPIGKVNDKK